MMRIKVVAFDADDTLWVNEPYYKAAEKSFCRLLGNYAAARTVSKELFKTEMNNLAVYGYGAKAFTLSMVETALRISGGKCGGEILGQVLGLGRELIEKPIELLPGVEEVLKALKNKFRLVMATKGDLLDQERKLKRSGLAHYFHHIEIMSDKKESDYRELIRNLDIAPHHFLMLGNSVKSDVLPVLALGGHAVHVPCKTLWAHEYAESPDDHPNFMSVDKIADVLPLLTKTEKISLP